MKIKVVNTQLFVKIEYTNRHSHKPTKCWYPFENLKYLKTDFKFV